MNNSTLEQLWYLYQSEYPLKVCTQEKELIKETEEYGDKLRASLNEQKMKCLKDIRSCGTECRVFQKKKHLSRA